jgi:hypothetical protein
VKLTSIVAILALVGGAAQAAAPVASGLTAGYSFEEYSGAAPVGSGQVDTSSVLFYIDEKTVAGVKSWYVFFDPAHSQPITVTLTFDAPIIDVIDTKQGLDGTNATYGIDVDHDTVLDDYTTSLFIAPERGDVTAWTAGGFTVTLDWNAVDPGDHIRVLTAAPVPEPETYALLLGGLGITGFVARRRKSARQPA